MNDAAGCFPLNENLFKFLQMVPAATKQHLANSIFAPIDNVYQEFRQAAIPQSMLSLVLAPSVVSSS